MPPAGSPRADGSLQPAAPTLSASDAFRFRRCLALLHAAGARIAPGDTWLDLGCHQGQLLRLLVARYGVRATGFDDWATSQKGPHDGGWDYVQSNLDRELPWSGVADFVSALEVLEHMIDTDGFLARIHARLKPGGYVLISTPNINSLRNRATCLLGIYPAGLEYRTVVHHVRLYNVGVLRRHLEDIGFCDIAVGGVSFLPLSHGIGTSALSRRLADAFPQLCNNIVAVARKPAV